MWVGLFSMRNRRHFLVTSITFLAVLLTPAISRGEEPAKSGDAKIEALINHVGSLSSAVFVRNGSEYDAKSAAKFLRGKWDANKKEIKTPEDFIGKVATKSSTSGKPYLIRFKDGKEVPCAEYLTGQLKTAK